MLENIKNWQALIGAIIGASSPFLLWWLAEKIKKIKDYHEKLYYLEKLFVDKINNVLDAETTIKNFINLKINNLIQNIQNNDEKTFSLDFAFFPLFSMVPINEDVLKINTKSGYIDNKIIKSYQLSRDMPLILKDVRRQFISCIQLNRQLALKKVNSPSIQKKYYIENIKKYKLMLEEDLLNKNFKIYLKILIETREALDEIRRINSLKWKIKFDPIYHFYTTKKKYIEAKNSVYDKIDKYFENKVKKKLLELQK